jgi:hypothetical protein
MAKISVGSLRNMIRESINEALMTNDVQHEIHKLPNGTYSISFGSFNTQEAAEDFVDQYMQLLHKSPYASELAKIMARDQVLPVKKGAPPPASTSVSSRAAVPPTVTRIPPVATREYTPSAGSRFVNPDKVYKVYGRTPDVPGAAVHARVSNIAYGSNNSKFRPNDRVYVKPEDGKLKVMDPESDHTQLWDRGSR